MTPSEAWKIVAPILNKASVEYDFEHGTAGGLNPIDQAYVWVAGALLKVEKEDD